MSLKKTDLARNMAMKIDGQMKGAGVPGRFAQGASDVADRKEQRRRDSAAGLVPFACKLPMELTKLIGERAASYDGGVNALVEQALRRGLDKL